MPRFRTAEESPNYQQRAREFSVGSQVAPFGTGNENSGTVVQVFPAIGMVEVQFPYGVKRYPVEDVQIFREDNAWIEPPGTTQVPGGTETVPVSGGPPIDPMDQIEDVEKEATPLRVAHAFIKKSLYWANKDRRYKATQTECDGGTYNCPKCGDSVLRKAIYKRRGGQSERLLGCPSCLFLIKREDILGDPSYVEMAEGVI